MKNILLLIIIITNTFALKAQSTLKAEHYNSTPKEKIFAHVSNNILLAGEKLYYNLYCLSLNNNKPSNFSKVAYVELYTSENKSIIKQKISLEKGIGNSDLPIATDLKTGSYKLIAYTSHMINQNIYFEEDFYIINPFETKLNTKTTSISKTDEETIENKISFSNKQIYKQRDLVTLSLNKYLKKGKYSISVNQKLNTNFPKKKTSKSFSKIKYITSENNKLKIPEPRGSIFHGKITPKGNFNVSNKIIGLTTISKNPITKTSVTNEKGEFYFFLQNLNTSEVSLQILEEERDNYNIVFNIEKDLNIKFSDYKTLNIDGHLSKCIAQKSLSMQIENSYSSVKNDSVIYKKLPSFFEGKTDVYKLNDYKRFTTIKQTIVEVVNNVYYTKKDNKYYIHTRTENTNKHAFLPTLVILDGYIIYNHNQLFDVNPYKIDKISVVRNKYIFGSEIYQGILIVNSIKRDYKPNPKFNKKFIVLAPEPDKIYFNESYLVDKKERLPDYRTQLYWNPSIKKTDEYIHFYTSDVKGKFEINIEGFKDDGEPISLKSSFTVE